MALRLIQRERRSLFGEILDWMLTPLLLLWPISLALTWLVAQNISDKPFDRAQWDPLNPAGDWGEPNRYDYSVVLADGMNLDGCSTLQYQEIFLRPSTKS